MNYWAILVAWLINIGVGSFWYSPAGFGRRWSRYTGVDLMKLPQKQSNKIITFVIFSGLVQATALAIILNSIGVQTMTDGAQVGLLLWLGLVTATTVGTTLYQGLGWKFLWLNSSYFLVVMAINSTLMGVWL